MKYILIAVMVCSCSTPFIANRMDYQINEYTLSEAWEYLSNFSYIFDTHDNWKTPAEFIIDGGGDCEDFAIMMVYLLGYKSKLVLLYTQNHAVVEYDGQWIEPQARNIYHQKIFPHIDMDYKTVMSIVTLGGLRMIEAGGNS